MNQNDTQESAVEHHPMWGPRAARDCRRCGVELHRRHPNGMCRNCVRETPGTDECPICDEYREEICGYHATCLWYCPDCGCIRRVGNHPSRPGSGDTVGCYNHPFRFDESHKMVRLTYTSTAEPKLRDYVQGGADA